MLEFVMNRRSAFWTMALLLTTCLCVSAQAQEKKEFRAGAVASNITPPLGEMIVGGWKPIPATHVHDELFARCLVLDDGTTKLAIVLCDNVGIPREVFDQAKNLIHDETTLPIDHMLMASTHTHSATTARGASKVLAEGKLTPYQAFIARRIADGVRRALNQLEPARIGWGSAEEPTEVFNRRWHVTDPGMLSNPFGGTDQVRMNPPRGNKALVKPAGPIDPEISFISVQSLDGRPIALLGNYSLHYVGGVRSGDVSADYFGIFAGLVERGLKAEHQMVPFVGIMSNGTSGDINNINFRGSSKRYERYEKMTEVATKVADRVLEAHKNITYHDWVPLGVAATELTLKTRRPTPEMVSYLAKAKEAEASELRNSKEKIYAERIDRILEAPLEISVPLQVIRIGDLCVNAIPFETFVEIGLELKDQTKFDDSFTIELANGSYGYLPTPEQHKLGGYETWLGTNYVQLDASERITETLLKMQQQVRGE